MTETSAKVLSRRDANELVRIATSLQVTYGHLEGLQLKLDDYVTTCTDLVAVTDHLYDAMAHLAEAWSVTYGIAGVIHGDLDRGFEDAS